MKRIVAILLVCVYSTLIYAGGKRVLFIGNSYTYVNDLPGTFQNIALSLGDTVYVSSVCPGGYTFNQHSINPATLDSIRLGNWDIIILQEQSQIPAFSPAQVQTDCVPYAKKLCDTINQYNACAEIVFYMTWGRKNGDASNCANYPPICTYAGMQQGLYDSYMMLCDSNHATCSPVGAAWRVFRNQYPTTELYSADESHPSINGTYLAACTFYSSIFRKPVINSQYSPAGLGTADGFYIRQVCDAVVLDSLEHWQSMGHLPRAGFNRSITGGLVNFTNTSLRATQYEWNFGDGTAISNASSPTHTYTTSGTYVVSLKATGSTCHTSIKKDTLQILVANGINDRVQDKIVTNLYTQGHQLFAEFKQAGTFTVFSMHGQLLFKNEVDANQQTSISLPSSGLYLWHWSNGRTEMKGKVTAH